MIVFILRILILVALILFVYTAYKYIMNPKRRLELAQDKQEFYFLDESENIRKNFLVTYKGVLFEGEKYLGTTESSFDVITITVWARNPNRLKGMSKDDLYFVEKEILIHYPHATIEWKYPINKLIK